ncbi:MAG: sulfotransferase [Gammaproteobacteria bacterium]
MTEESLLQPPSTIDTISDNLSSLAAKTQSPTTAIFIVGCSQSGKTLLSNMLNTLPDIFSFRELHFFERLWQIEDNQALPVDEAAQLYAMLEETQENGILNIPQKMPQKNRMGTVQQGKQPPENTTAPHIYMSFLTDYAQQKKPGAIPCEQTPTNVLFINEILELWPRARIIHMIRDPRDVFLAKKRKWRNIHRTGQQIPWQEIIRQKINLHPYFVASVWKADATAADSAKDRIYNLRFEDLINQPEKHFQKVCKFAGIPYDESLKVIRDNLLPNLLPGTGKTGNWQQNRLLDMTDQFIIQTMTMKGLHTFQYPVEKAMPNILTLFWYIISFPVRIMLAVVANKNRVRHIRKAIRRRMAF